MKKYLIIFTSIFILSFSLTANASPVVTVDPDSITSVSGEIIINISGLDEDYETVLIFDPSGTLILDRGNTENESFILGNNMYAYCADPPQTYVTLNGTYHLVSINTGENLLGDLFDVWAGDCPLLSPLSSYTDAIGSEYFSGVDVTFFVGSSESSDMSTIISNASTSLLGAVGVSNDDIVGIMWSMASIILGTGLGILSAVLPYVLSLVVIASIVYFLYRGFRLLRS